MPYITLNEHGTSVREVVKFVEPDTPGATYIDYKVATRIAKAMDEERELINTLRTGLPRKVRGVK